MKHLFQATAIFLLINFCVIQKTSSQTKEELTKTYSNETIHIFEGFL